MIEPTAQTDQGSADDGKGKDEYPHGRLVSARGDDEFTGFAYGAVAAGQGADPVCAAADFGLAISHGERQSGPDHQGQVGQRSEVHTSELQSRGHLVCRLLLDNKKLYITVTVIDIMLTLT